MNGFAHARYVRYSQERPSPSAPAVRADVITSRLMPSATNSGVLAPMGESIGDDKLMTSQHGKTRRWQFDLATLLLIFLAVSLIFANVVPRYSTTGTQPGFVVKHWYRGFPFIYAEDVESPSESRGTRNLAALVGDIVIAGLIVAFLANQRLVNLNRAGAP